MKKLLMIGALCVSTLSIVSAKSYDIIISTTVKAGTVQLKPGEYRLKVDGGNATFYDVNTDKSFTTPVKVETSDKKFDQTKVDTTKDGDQNKLQDIELGGSNTRLEF
jgi:hypothetical protein